MTEVTQNPQGGQSGEQTTVQPTVDKFDIPGFGEVTLDELKEYKNGYMRQDDYTRKTQALAEERKSMMFNQQTPQPTATPVQQSQPQVKPVQSDLEVKVEKLLLETELSRLKSKHSDFNEVAVLDKAIMMMNNGVPASAIDYEMLYKATRNVDEQSIREQILRELNASANTDSLINGGSGNPPASQQITLNPDEDKIRIKMGISVEDWIKYK